MRSEIRIHLRHWRTDDLDAAFQWRNDLNLQQQLMARAQPETREEVQAWLEHKSQQPTSEFLLIARREDDCAVGYVQAVAIDLRSSTADLGICIASNEQGKGFGREACQLFHSHLKLQLGLRKLVLRVLAGNERAITMYRKLGYRDVGTLTSHHKQSGGYHDVLIMETFLTS